MDIKRRNKTSYILLRVAGRLYQINKKIRNYGTDQQLFDAEIHMIKLIKEHEGMHITGLAEILNVTKGAVSQIIMKLEKKGMVVKKKDLANQSRMFIELTPKGDTAYKTHEQLHAQLDEEIEKALEGASKEEETFLNSFLHYLEQRLLEFEE